MFKKFYLSTLCASAVCAFASTSALADQQTYTYRTGPIEVGGYEVRQEQELVQAPKMDGNITAMDVDVVDADGTSVPIKRIMLHHIVFVNIGKFMGDRIDGTCTNGFRDLEGTKHKVMPERFYGAGEERAKMALPPGYGYKINKDDRWAMPWMLMNHGQKTDTVYIQYHVTIDTSPDLKQVKPYWLDVAGCKSDPIFDVPGGGKPGSTYKAESTWASPQAGRIVSGGGHVHGGGKSLAISEPGCSDRQLYTSKPTWAPASHPFYNVKPILHEPGPLAMSGFLSPTGIPVAKGEELKLTARYDAERLHPRSMGIFMIYLSPDESITKNCETVPSDVTSYTTDQPGRAKPPVFTVPLTGLDVNGKAQTIQRPAGKTTVLDGDTSINVGELSFSKPNISVPLGAKVKWDFGAKTLHDVTVANGPFGFSSPHLNKGKVFSHTFKKPGTYKLFCALHPVDMTETVTVRKKK